jgi:hypothetical protein
MTDSGVGIIIKRFLPYKQKIIVFDRDRGPIEVVPEPALYAQRLCHGALISYTLRQQRNVSFLKTIDILQVPFEVAKNDILFLHHILELAYYFAPLDSSCSRLFDLIHLLYTPTPFINESLPEMARLYKKFFLIRFFMIVGLYPDDLLPQAWVDLCSNPVDSLVDQRVQLTMEASMNKWLMQCVQMHPHSNLFNTIHFLDRKNS